MTDRDYMQYRDREGGQVNISKEAPKGIGKVSPQKNRPGG
jgi:hypothetical protein